MYKGDLSGPNCWLVEQGQQIGFGSITFRVCGGEPVPAGPWSRARTQKVDGGLNGPRPEAAKVDFELRHEYISLFEQLKNLPDGTCVRVKFAHGLPGSSFDIIEEQQAA